MTHKDTKGKAKLSLIPNAAMIAISKVREFGVNKYKDDEGWKEVNPQDFIDATLRHIYKYLDLDQSDVDPESGFTHLEHALTSLALAVSVEDLIDKHLIKNIEDTINEPVMPFIFNSQSYLEGRFSFNEIGIEILESNVDVNDVDELFEKIQHLYMHGYFSDFVPYTVLKVKEGKSYIKFRI